MSSFAGTVMRPASSGECTDSSGRSCPESISRQLFFMFRDALTRLVNYTFLASTKMAVSTLRNVYAHFEEQNRSSMISEI